MPLWTSGQGYPLAHHLWPAFQGCCGWVGKNCGPSAAGANHLSGHLWDPRAKVVSDHVKLQA
ncbi:hypothetical protein PGTUg99_012979 [Puccinia graminis f. sp. tritici]|uniref:Uncharacterized protein n=1 Tax=Puccinia graminis f. sp. tritici TaxID=56615 RepID=A0A5B0NT53_PUCGR|nr:hypothetical protein PGTUg99_012979 [Puccinia graminis f. sp. tritici]